MLKYTVTLGPASSSENVIARLLRTADAFRLNSSHLTVQDLNSCLKQLNNIFIKNKKTIPVVIDLQGSKMRIGNYPGTAFLPEIVEFKYSESSSELKIIPVPHSDFFSTVKPGKIILMNDAKIKARITNNGKSNAEAVVLQNGPLSSNKGINLENHPITLSDLTSKDKDIIGTAMSFDFTQFAYSFLLDGRESEYLKKLTENRKLIAKIERTEAFSHLNEIAVNFDEIWLCRGDLGAQAGIQNLGKLQSNFIDYIPSIKKECILAGQVLEHMTYFPTPTRSEVVHLFETEKNGFTGIVLSDETAVGKNPINVADFLDSLSK